jgi:hypothetical protein
MSGSSDSAIIPVLGKETVFSDFQSDGKAYLHRKEVLTYCTKAATSDKDADVVAGREKCAGILWSMLSKDLKPLIKEYEFDL